MSSFVRPETDTVTLSTGERLLLKRRLNAGEQLDAFTRLVKQIGPGEISYKPEQVGLSKITSYLVNWSLTDATGLPVAILDRPITEIEAALRSLDPAIYNEIRDVINAHEVRVDQAYEEEKKQRTGSGGEPSPRPVSASVA